MRMLKIFAAGALSYFGYKAWQRYRAEPDPIRLQDDSERTAPHGDPLLPGVEADTTAKPRAGAQSSPRFGDA
ncbi:hypothetical protein LDO26_11350 [Luteimonas sp. BDR2-5]|uniref:hypothetical protein n=1 Tax=Proluteimonas luteida TaxID=2878685 RepID=UPI001E3D1ADB|nr:hypothetical protein [Luteimonas sp. BDR2-5]MCD9028802.1 hypothetical protein [Luteimonas sp. BDR2-5]